MFRVSLMQANYRTTIAANPSGQVNPVAQTIDSLQNPLGVSILLTLLLSTIAGGIYSGIKIYQLNAQLRIEKLKKQDLVRKLKFALDTITAIERNPDLVHSREFNLDYLSMRMDEDSFRNVILAQIKYNLKQKVLPALLPPNNNEEKESGKVRQIDVIFDVPYMPDHREETTQPKVLFRIQVKMAKIPTQSTNNTIKDLTSGLVNFISATEENRNWQPTIQGRIATISWDQKAKPTPLLVIEQTNEGSNVSFRSRPIVRPSRQSKSAV